MPARRPTGRVSSARQLRPSLTWGLGSRSSAICIERRTRVDRRRPWCSSSGKRRAQLFDAAGTRPERVVAGDDQQDRRDPTARGEALRRSAWPTRISDQQDGSSDLGRCERGSRPSRGRSGAPGPCRGPAGTARPRVFMPSRISALLSDAASRAGRGRPPCGSARRLGAAAAPRPRASLRVGVGRPLPPALAVLGRGRRLGGLAATEQRTASVSSGACGGLGGQGPAAAYRALESRGNLLLPRAVAP